MEETEDEIDSNLILSSAKKIKSKSCKNNCILKKTKYQSKEKFQIDSIQKIFNQGITSNQPVKMIFTSNNVIKPLPILSNGPKNKKNNKKKTKKNGNGLISKSNISIISISFKFKLNKSLLKHKCKIIHVTKNLYKIKISKFSIKFSISDNK